MTDPSHPGGRRPGHPPGTGSGTALPVGRTLAVLVVFVLATLLLVGQIHPGVAVSTAGRPTTTTSAPTGTTTGRSRTTATEPRGKVPVLVANASGATGAAGLVSTRLQAAGWDVLPPVNASSTVTASSVYYVTGHQQPASAVASTLGLPASSVHLYASSAPVTAIGTAQVVVVAGPDLAHSTATTAAGTG